MPKLERLHLSGTGLHGNLSGLAELALHVLDLSKTAVTGSLRDLAGFCFQDGGSRGMRNLQRLGLSSTAVTGNFSTLMAFTRLELVDLSYTAVTGWITDAWRDKCLKLQTLKLRSSSVQFVPRGDDLKKLTGPVNSPVESLLLPLSMCHQLSSVQATGAGLFGEMPKLTQVAAISDGKERSMFTYPLAKSLLMLDFSNNNVTGLYDLPVHPNVRRIFLRKNHELNVEAGLLIKALKQQIILDLSGTTLNNQEEAAKLVSQGVMKTTNMHALRDETGGFACKDLVSATLKVTPSKFLPQQLCKCLPGWHGTGATCQNCPPDKFSDDLGFDMCKTCPANSTAPEGSSKLSDCKCGFGNMHNGTCACDMQHALQNGECILCSKLHLQCASAGSLASTAVPEVNYTCLEPSAQEARRCLPPGVAERCPGSYQCGAGYSGSLCSICADGFWATGGQCQPCAEATSSSVGLLVLLGVAVLLLAAVLVYRHFYGQQVQVVESEARLFCASVERESQHTKLRLEMLDEQLPAQALPKRLLAAKPQLACVLMLRKRSFEDWTSGTYISSMCAWGFKESRRVQFLWRELLISEAAAAAYMAVHCRGMRRVQLHSGYITIAVATSQIEEEDMQLDVMKAVTDAKTSRKVDV
eukprot:Skav213753  [mRNA]  locus=scaffold258:205763:209989:+ [translate_table: standard]